jgi:hypothetical protein
MLLVPPYVVLFCYLTTEAHATLYLINLLLKYEWGVLSEQFLLFYCNEGHVPVILCTGG